VIVPFTDGRKGYNVLANLTKTLDTGGVELSQALERSVTLAVIDENWKEHLRAMDDLKQSVQTAYLEQKDPLVIYKMEAYQLFRNMNADVNRNIVNFLCHATLPTQQQEAGLREGRQQRTDMSRMRANKEEIETAGQDYAANEQDKPAPITAGPKIGRNDPCPCGSGKKFKQCHGRDL
jgi:preprotein translocase subunit SecA